MTVRRSESGLPEAAAGYDYPMEKDDIALRIAHVISIIRIVSIILRVARTVKRCGVYSFYNPVAVGVIHVQVQVGAAIAIQLDHQMVRRTVEVEHPTLERVGLAAYLTKPLNLGEVIDLVDRTLPKVRAGWSSGSWSRRKTSPSVAIDSRLSLASLIPSIIDP
jgi:hypothetical protein